MIASLLAAALLSGCTLLGYERSHNLADDIDGTVEAMDAYGASRTEAFNSLSVLVAEPRSDAAESFESTVVEADLMLVQSAAFVAYIKDLSRVLSNDLTDSGVSGVSNDTQKAGGFDAELVEMSKPIRSRLVAAADAIHAKSTRN